MSIAACFRVAAGLDAASARADMICCGGELRGLRRFQAGISIGSMGSWEVDDPKNNGSRRKCEVRY